MSTEAGSGHSSMYYSIFLGSGIRVAILPNPNDEDPSKSIGDYFKAASEPFKARLKKAAPEIDKLFLKAIEEKKLPIIKYKSKYEWIYGVIIENNPKNKRDPLADHEEEHGRKWFEKGKSALLQFDGFLKDMGRFEVTIAINSQIKRTDLDWLASEIKTILSKK